jgi:DNA modification methylase
MSAGGGDKKSGRAKLPAPIAGTIDDKADAGRARDQAAKLYRVSSRSIGDAKVVKAHDRALYADIQAGRVNINQAMRAVKRSIKSATATKAAKTLPPLDAASCDIRSVDCIAGLETVPSGSVRLVFADPPYNCGVDYGKGAKADQLPPIKFSAWCDHWIAECRRVLTPDGSIFVMIDRHYTGDIGSLLAGELHRRNLIVWHETFGTYTDDNFTSCARFIHYYTKDPQRYVFNGDAIRVASDRQAKYGDKRADPAGKVPGNVWPFPRVCDNHPERVPGFPTQLPLALVERIVLAASEPGDLILDPFVGSGTTPVTAVTHGRRFVGFDNNAKYVAAATPRVQAAVAAANAGRVP